MSNQDQDEQVYHQWHQLMAQQNQIGEYLFGKIKQQQREMEILRKNKIPKHETETVPNNPEKKTK